MLKIIYIKSFKVASTTIAAILQRLSDEYGLKVGVLVVLRHRAPHAILGTSLYRGGCIVLGIGRTRHLSLPHRSCHRHLHRRALSGNLAVARRIAYPFRAAAKCTATDATQVANRYNSVGVRSKDMFNITLGHNFYDSVRGRETGPGCFVGQREGAYSGQKPACYSPP